MVRVKRWVTDLSRLARSPASFADRGDELSQPPDGSGYSLTAQSNGSGEITCRVTVDGEEIARQTSTGQYAVVSCSGSDTGF